MGILKIVYIKVQCIRNWLIIYLNCVPISKHWQSYCEGFNREHSSIESAVIIEFDMFYMLVFENCCADPFVQPTRVAFPLEFTCTRHLINIRRFILSIGFHLFCTLHENIEI